jgi:hypothetical protein
MFNSLKRAAVLVAAIGAVTLAGSSTAVAGGYVGGGYTGGSPVDHEAGQTMRLPSAPSATTETKPHSLYAVSPTISGNVRTIHVSQPGYFTCETGNLCTWVWDPTTGDFKVFFLYNCATYHLYNWYGDGGFKDNQYGNPISTFWGQYWNKIRTFTPSPAQLTQNWNDVWHITNC